MWSPRQVRAPHPPCRRSQKEILSRGQKYLLKSVNASRQPLAGRVNREAGLKARRDSLTTAPHVAPCNGRPNGDGGRTCGHESYATRIGAAEESSTRSHLYRIPVAGGHGFVLASRH